MAVLAAASAWASIDAAGRAGAGEHRADPSGVERPDTWNLAALSPITRTYQVGVGDFTYHAPRHIYAGWVQDDWTIAIALTLNLGLRYDLSLGAFADEIEFPPFLEANRPPTRTTGPAARLRLQPERPHGRARRLRHVLRRQLRAGRSRHARMDADRQPADRQRRPARLRGQPVQRPVPTFEQAVAARVSRQQQAGLHAADHQLELRQRAAADPLQLSGRRSACSGRSGNTMSVEADYVYQANRHEWYSRNINLTYNPATGANYPVHRRSPARRSRSAARRQPVALGGRSRTSTRWRPRSPSASATAGRRRPPTRWRAMGSGRPGVQRRRARHVPARRGPRRQRPRWPRRPAPPRAFNGIWQVPYGFQVSGLYFFGSGERFATTYGGDLRDIGVAVDQPAAPGRHDRAAQQLRRRSDPSRRPAGAAPLPSVGRASLDGIARSVQPVQPRELRHVRHRRRATRTTGSRRRTRTSRTRRACCSSGSARRSDAAGSRHRQQAVTRGNGVKRCVVQYVAAWSPASRQLTRRLDKGRYPMRKWLSSFEGA